MNDQVKRIEDQLRRAFEGDAWHGPSVKTILSGVTAREAARWTVPGVHTIWEIVQHVAAWEDIVRRRIEGETITSVPDAEDWPPVGGTSDEDWTATLSRLEAGHRRLRAAIARLDDARLDEPVNEKDYTLYIMLHGIVQHDLYHAGQIALLKKAARSA